MSAENIKRRILAFCEERGYHVHPAKDLDAHVKRVIELGGCPCDQRRKECPCPQSVGEIERGRGACACTIICSKDYLEEWHYIGKMPLYLREKRRPLVLFKEKK